jgi:hypothetical protein
VQVTGRDLATAIDHLALGRIEQALATRHELRPDHRTRIVEGVAAQMLADCAGQVQFQRLVTQSLQARLHRGLAGQDAAHLAAAAVAGNAVSSRNSMPPHSA